MLYQVRLFYDVGNQIRVRDIVNINGNGGLVEKIEVRTIPLRDFAGVVHIFQNGKINALYIITKECSAIVFDIGVAYKEDPDKVITVIQKVGQSYKPMKSLAQISSSLLKLWALIDLKKVKLSSKLVLRPNQVASLPWVSHSERSLNICLTRKILKSHSLTVRFTGVLKLVHSSWTSTRVV